ncbi:MAG: hypothetical protein U9N83_10530, partial [Thermodesulfobacteriota bacterium]|nr:hypothetical protein [Thermodesulfobacteriota bacterium]
MSGFAVIFNKQDPSELENMFQRIAHRGPYIYGKFEYKRVLMAQNYLKSDICLKNDKFLEPDENQFPAFNPKLPKFRICYDGQMGNWTERAKPSGEADGPFREERLFVHLYKQYDSQMFEYLDDAIFAFVISDGENLFAARDLLGIKTLFYGRKNG